MEKITLLIRSCLLIFILLCTSYNVFANKIIGSDKTSSDTNLVCHSLFDSANLSFLKFEESKVKKIATSKIAAKPTITLGNNPSVCKSDTSAKITYSTTTGNPNKYSITFSTEALAQGFQNTTAATLPTSPKEIPIVIPANLSSGSYSANLAISNPAGERSSNYSISVTIKESPTVNKPNDYIVCNNEIIPPIIYSGNNINGVIYNWTNNNPAINLSASGTGDITSFQAKNSGDTPITATIKVSPIVNGCTGETQEYKITVNPSPKFNKPADVVICDKTTTPVINFTGTTVSGTNYIWANNNTSIGLAASGNGSIPSFQARNTSNSPISATITIIPTANNCEGESQIFKITVNPTAKVNQPLDVIVCNEAAVPEIKFSGSTVSGTTYSWINNNPTIGLAALGNGNISAFTAKNTGNAPISASITVTPKANECEGIPVTFKITVNPTPKVNDVIDYAICNGDSFSKIIFEGSPVSGTKYNWTNNDTSIGLSGNGTEEIPAFTAVNNTTVPVTANILVTPVANNCDGDVMSFKITINPTPTITKPADIVVCDGEMVEEIILKGSSVSGTRRNWINDNIAIGLKATGQNKINSFIATNPTNQTVFATITINPIANDCEGIPETFKIEVKPKPRLIAPENQIYCNGVLTSTIPLSGSPNDILYDITGGAAIGLSNKLGVTEVPAFNTIPGNATILITPKSNTCIGEPVTYNIQVNPTPTVSLTPSSQTICSGELSNISLSGSLPETTFKWIITGISPPGSISGAIEGSGENIEQQLINNTNGVATVKYKIIPTANNCDGTPITAIINVNPTPILQITIPECLESVDLTSPNIKNGNTTSGLTYTYWTNAEATVPLSNPSSVEKGFFYIKGTTIPGCYIVKEVEITKLKPVLSNILDAPSQICSGSNFDFTPISSLENTSITWTRAAIGENPANQSDDKNIENPNETLLNVSSSPIIAKYIFKLETADGCINTSEINVNILPEPQLITNPVGDRCNGEEISHNLSSNLGNASINWRREAFLNNPRKTGSGNIMETLYNDSGNTVGVTYYITLSTSEGCSSEKQVNFSLLSGPKVTANASAIEICPGSKVNLSSVFENQGTLPSVLIDENFNASLSNWNTINNTTGGNTNASAWTIRNNNYDTGYGRIKSNDNSKFYLSNSDASGSGSSTNTILQYNKPINTIGYSTLNLSFWSYFRKYYDADNAVVQVSTINSNNDNDWTTIKTYTSDVNGVQNVDLSGFTGKQSLFIRFKYSANWGYWWALDNISISGTTKTPNVIWTSSTDPNWSSNEQNPQNVYPAETTIYTATYSDPDIECPGIGKIEVTVRQPPAVTITPNYCGDSTFIELVSDNIFASYQWESAGNIIGTDRSVNIELAQTYTLTVTDNFGCMGIGSISVSDELLTNGDFSQGNIGFYTEYQYVNDNPNTRNELNPEGYFAVNEDAHNFHNNFYGKDHTTGNGNFMIINGHPGSGKVIWRQTITNIQPNTNYYFSAWGMNLNPGNPARLQFQVNGVPTGTIADLKDAPKPTSNGQVNTNNWIQFYSNPFWNSGNSTTAVLEIINLETIRNGNDFGIDDVSFGTLEPIIFSISPSNNSAICEGSNLELYANIEGGRDPIEFEWTNPSGEIISTEENPVLENLLTADSGIYTLTVIDGYGCSPQIGTTEVIIVPETIVDAGEDQSVCAENAEIQLRGSILGSITTGNWTGGNGSFIPNRNKLDAIYTPSTEEISAGSVILTLISNLPDAPCEPVLDTIILTINPTPIVDSIETTMPSCYQGSNGTAKVILPAGTGPYTYVWSDGQTSQMATGLTAGEYNVLITNEFGCSITKEISITDPSLLEIVSSSFTPVQCFGGTDGSVSIEITGGVLEEESPNYNISLLDKEGIEIYREEDNSSGFLTVSNLIASTYTFIVSTSKACTSLSTALTVNQPDESPAYAGEDITIAECGTTIFNLSASEIDPSVASGNWTISLPIDGGEGSFSDSTSRKSSFEGKANTEYILRWTVTPTNGCPPIFDELIITFPPSCSKLDFDGVDDYVDFGDNFNLRNSENAFSLEAWVKPNSIKGINTIISKRNLNDLTDGGYDLILNKGKPSIRLNNKTISTTQSIGTDRWYHIAAVQEGNLINLYVDGIKLKTDNLSTKPGDINSPMLIGAMYDPAEPLNPKNNFHGWIEEVRIWKTGLNQEQVRFMMNQRIKNNNGNVQGEVIPMDVPTNLSWNNLEGYYRLITGEVENGFALDHGTSGISGLLKNIETTQENSAPLPYISKSDGKWFDSNSWLQSNVWNAPNTTGINGSLINWNIARISHNLKSEVKDITLLGLLSEENSLIMGKKNNKNQGQGLTISHYLKLDGFIDLAGKSQLVQNENSVLDESSLGYIEIDQQGTASSYNYNYWSSPVGEQAKSNNSPFKIKTIMLDGSNSNTPTNLDFGNGVTYADGPFATPRKISNYWIYKFRGTADQYSEWEHIGSEGVLKTGEGFTMKGTSGNGKINEEQNYVFTGKPNNGTIKLTVGKDQNYLLGNPYPSAIDAHEFLLDNIKANGGRNDDNIFNGALYFWDHFGGKTHILREYIGGYATKNLIDAVPAISTDERINSNGNRGVKKPEKFIAVGQGFFINTSLDPYLPENISVTGGEVVFKNSQRFFIPETPGNSQFLKPEKINKETIDNDVRAKIRLDYKSPMGYHRQILVGADVNTTNGFDLGYDAPLNDYNLEDFFWLIDNREYVIQGVSNFDLEQVLPIGIYITQEGEFTIEINALDNVPEETNIYVKDLEQNKFYDLREAKFKLDIAPGAYYERFQIVFQSDEDIAANTDEDTEEESNPDVEEDGSGDSKDGPDSNTNLDIIYTSTNRELAILNPDNLEIQKVVIYNLLGQKIQEFTEIENKKIMPLRVEEYPAAVYVVKMFSEKGEISKNIILMK
ncbi:SprB-like repeat protein [Gillisia mitskevichiae]|uniref:SprB-like repeat protein n=1 Tax=Gillisia mitskevichiae TaxID=270921 RepID=A0A495NYC8_9FLAO|nr:PKD-like domain-containing protein [Gillisia mitskevichiae]RKS43451.1 SprB-like repeat protein [Gillisia mitskevichiae]